MQSFFHFTFLVSVQLNGTLLFFLRMFLNLRGGYGSSDL